MPYDDYDDDDAYDDDGNVGDVYVCVSVVMGKR